MDRASTNRSSTNWSSASVTHEQVFDVAARPDGSEVYAIGGVTKLVAKRTLIRLSSDLQPIGEPVSIPAAISRAFAVSSTSSTGVALYLVGQNRFGRGSGVLYALAEDLTSIWSIVLPFGPSDAIRIAGGRRIGMVSYEANSYWEVDVETRAIVLLGAVPFFSGLAALSYDEDRDRVFISGGARRIISFDRATSRAQQDAVVTEFMSDRLFFNPRSRRLLAFATAAGHADLLRLSP